jgi:predicted ester cyclase
MRAAKLLVIGSFLAACGGGSKSAKPVAEPAPAPPPVAEPAPPPAPQPPPPPPPTREQIQQATLDRYNACEQAFAARDWDKLGGCFADDAVASMSDMPHKTTGKDISEKMFKHHVEAFSDFQVKDELVIVNNDHMATLIVGGGTNDGPFMDMPATHKKISVYGLRLIDFAGDKIKSDLHITDPTTWMGQMGLVKLPHRGPATPPASPTVVMAKGDKAEDDNVAVVKALCESFDKHDAAAITAAFADDGVVSDMTMPADTKGKKKIAALMATIFKAFPDMKGSCQPWGAGDYVVNLVEWTATNKGPFPGFIKKATNKQVTVHDGEIYQLAGGKIVHFWRLSNGMAMGMQLGLMPPPGAHGAKPAKPGKKK